MKVVCVIVTYNGRGAKIAYDTFREISKGRIVEEVFYQIYFPGFPSRNQVIAARKESITNCLLV